MLCMKYIITFFIVTGFLSIPGYTQSDPGIFMADPTIFRYEGTYYLYGTHGAGADSGFYVMTSKDLQHWHQGAKGKRVLERGVVYGSKGFWAPQVFWHRGNIYMAYTANEQIAIAAAENPGGPFVQEVQQPLPATGKQIDPFIFRDDDGKLYFYHVRLQNGNRIYVAEMKQDLSGVDGSTLRECINAEEGWENTRSAPWPVAEGPTVMKVNGKYVMFYSANDFRNPDYAVGYAVADHPLGPWKKAQQNPIISRANTGYNGPGHGDIIRDESGQYHYVFHTHFSGEKVAPRRTAIVTLSIYIDAQDGVSVKVDPDTFRLLQAP